MKLAERRVALCSFTGYAAQEEKSLFFGQGPGLGQNFSLGLGLA